jgi:hypothetical protein
MARFRKACDEAKKKEEYLLKYGVFEYVFTTEEEPDVVKGVLIPDTRATQWEHTFYYRNGSRECDYCSYARNGTWTASPIYTIDENTRDPLNMIKLEPVPQLRLGFTLGPPMFTRYRPVGIAKLIQEEEAYLREEDDY